MMLSSAQVLAGLWPLFSLCIVMVVTSLQDASPTVNLLESAHEQEGALI
jgi:hypothetical protein